VVTLGTDTGGSIRQPASFCGIVGLKPSYGRVSRFGCTAYASSLEQIGPMTRNVTDAALILQVIAGPDPADSTCRREPLPDFSKSLSGGIKGLRLGLPEEYFGAGIDPEVRAAVEKAVRTLEQQGAEIHPVTLPHTSSAVATYYIIATAEASANLARFDGIRYGHRCENPENLLDLYNRSRAEGFGPEVKRRIILGTYVLSSGYYDAYYRKAQKVRYLIRQDFTRAFEKVDLILGPTCPTPAFKFGAHTSDPLQMYLADIYTIAANLAGLCGISLPCGRTAATGDSPALPIGLQLLAPPLGEPTLLQAAYAAEEILGDV
jgi:aspartyl-tRNA(Asn)/glutamyl-tRNA(Gln) amidotransferase subunit A